MPITGILMPTNKETRRKIVSHGIRASDQEYEVKLTWNGSGSAVADLISQGGEAGH